MNYSQGRNGNKYMRHNFNIIQSYSKAPTTGGYNNRPSSKLRAKSKTNLSNQVVDIKNQTTTKFNFKSPERIERDRYKDQESSMGFAGIVGSSVDQNNKNTISTI